MAKEDYLESQPLAGHGDSLDGISHSVDEDVSFDRSQLRRAPARLSLLIVAVLLLVTNIASGFVGAYIGGKQVDLDAACAEHTTQYSPVIKDVNIKYEFRDFNGSFMEDGSDVYRRPASPEVDAAWDALGVNSLPGVIPEEEGARSGLTEAHVRRAEKYGGGYLVNVEGMHHLHCLNLVRQALFYNYEYYKELGTEAFSNTEDIVRQHVSHCLDTVRQVLMCNVDTAVLGQVWYAGTAHPAAFPDFKTKHMCKNYDDVAQYARELQLPPAKELPKDFLRQPEPQWILPKMP